MDRVLITGGAGFLGSYVLEELIGRAIEPVIFDHRHERLEGWSGDWTVYLGDIRDETAVNEAVAHVDGVIHLAGVLGTQETVQHPRPAAETNILGGLNVLEACSQYDVPLVNIAVGNWWENNTYSITKNAIERFATMYANFRGTRVSVVRALNAYGPRQVPSQPYGPSRVRKIMPSFICRALDDQPIEVYGDGEQVMDMIHARDVARILVEALVQTNFVGAIKTTLEAGTNRSTTVNDIARMVANEVSAQMDREPVSVRHLDMRPGEAPGAVVLGDPSTLAPLGMDGRDFVRLEAGIQETVAYFARGGQ